MKWYTLKKMQWKTKAWGLALLMGAIVVAMSTPRIEAQSNPTQDPNRTESRLQLYNEYIATYCDLIPAYRTEITLGVNPDMTPKPPFRLGHNAILGTFTYRPKRYAELSPEQQADMESDPEFLAFRERKIKENEVLVQTITQGNLVEAEKINPQSTQAWDPAGVADVLNVRISPEDILSDKPLIYAEPGWKQGNKNH